MAEDETTLEEGSGEGGGEKGKGKKSSLTLILIIVGGLVVLGGGGFAAYKFLFASSPPPAEKQAPAQAAAKSQAKDAKADKDKAAPPEAGQMRSMVPLEPFIVNLADPTGNRYLKIRLTLDLGSDAGRSEVEANTAKIRDAVLLLLSSKTFGEIGTMEGKLKLRSEILTQINRVLPTARVTTVYFTELVVQ